MVHSWLRFTEAANDCGTQGTIDVADLVARDGCKFIEIDGHHYEVPSHYAEERLVKEGGMYSGGLVEAAEEAIHYHQESLDKRARDQEFANRFGE